MRSLRWVGVALFCVVGCNAAHETIDGGGDDAASVVDSGAFECDAPPIGYCRALVAAGGSTCCGGSAAPLCRVGGGYACGPGAIEETRCGACVATAACTSPTECTVVPATCCGRCGVATSGDLVAVRVDQTSAWQTAACGGGPVACPDCAAMPDPYLVAACVAGNCVAQDLHVDPLTECTADADCTLAPSTCCGCGEIGLGGAIAYNPTRGSLASRICDPRADCPPCVPTFTGIAARCDAGRCTVMAL